MTCVVTGVPHWLQLGAAGGAVVWVLVPRVSGVTLDVTVLLPWLQFPPRVI